METFSSNFRKFHGLAGNQGPSSLDRAVVKFTEKIKTALNTATKEKYINPFHSTYTIPHDLKQLIEEKKQIKNRAARTGDPSLKTEANRLTQRIKEGLKELTSREWEEKTKDLKLEDNSLWKMARNFKRKRTQIPPLLVNDNIIDDPTEKLEALANSIENQFTPNIGKDIPREDRIKLTVKIIQDLQIVPSKSCYQLNTDQTKEIIGCIKNKKAPGPDEIPGIALQKLPEKQIVELTNIINSTFKLCHFPTPWKHASLALIKKPNKPDNDPTSYRPISLLSAIGKVAERAIADKIRFEMEKLDNLPNEQIGFRTQHSTIHQTTRMAHNIIKNLNRKHHVQSPLDFT